MFLYRPVKCPFISPEKVRVVSVFLYRPVKWPFISPEKVRVVRALGQ